MLTIATTLNWGRQRVTSVVVDVAEVSHERPLVPVLVDDGFVRNVMEPLALGEGV